MNADKAFVFIGVYRRLSLLLAFVRERAYNSRHPSVDGYLDGGIACGKRPAGRQAGISTAGGD
jgi:hypothetical protein